MPGTHAPGVRRRRGDFPDGSSVRPGFASRHGWYADNGSFFPFALRTKRPEKIRCNSATRIHRRPATWNANPVFADRAFHPQQGVARRWSRSRWPRLPIAAQTGNIPNSLRHENARDIQRQDYQLPRKNGAGAGPPSMAHVTLVANLLTRGNLRCNKHMQTDYMKVPAGCFTLVLTACGDPSSFSGMSTHDRQRRTSDFRLSTAVGARLPVVRVVTLVLVLVLITCGGAG